MKVSYSFSVIFSEPTVRMTLPLSEPLAAGFGGAMDVDGATAFFGAGATGFAGAVLVAGEGLGFGGGAVWAQSNPAAAIGTNGYKNDFIIHLLSHWPR